VGTTTTSIRLGGGPSTQRPGKVFSRHEETNDEGISEGDGLSNY